MLFDSMSARHLGAGRTAFLDILTFEHGTDACPETLVTNQPTHVSFLLGHHEPCKMDRYVVPTRPVTK